MTENYEEYDNRPDHTQKARRHDPIGRKEPAPIDIFQASDACQLIRYHGIIIGKVSTNDE
jgi:hypothetical protein